MNLVKKITIGMLAFAMLFTMTFAIVPPMEANAETGTVTLNFPEDGPYCSYYEADGVTPIAAGSTKTIPTMAEGESYNFIVVPKLGYAFSSCTVIDHKSTPAVFCGGNLKSPVKVLMTVKGADTDGTVINLYVQEYAVVTTAKFASECKDNLDYMSLLAPNAVDKLPVDTDTKEALKSPLANYVSTGKADIDAAGNDETAVLTAYDNALNKVARPGFI